MATVVIRRVGENGIQPLLQLDYEEALTLLALLNANPSYANRSIRKALGEYIDKLPTK